MVDRILARAASEVEAGRPWRGREILRGAIRTHCLDVRFLEAYGRLLDQLGDRTEAGKFLFLSGVRGPDVDPAIALFLARHAKAPLRHLVSQFPAKARRVGLDAFPEVVRHDLERLGLPESPNVVKSMEDRAAPVRRTRNVVGAVLGTTIFVLLVVAMFIGLGQMVSWIL